MIDPNQSDFLKKLVFVKTQDSYCYYLYVNSINGSLKGTSANGKMYSFDFSEIKTLRELSSPEREKYLKIKNGCEVRK